MCADVTVDLEFHYKYCAICKNALTGKMRIGYAANVWIVGHKDKGKQFVLKDKVTRPYKNQMVHKVTVKERAGRRCRGLCPD